MPATQAHRAPDCIVTTAGLAQVRALVDDFADALIRVWDPAAPGSASIAGHHPHGLHAVAVTPDGRVVSGGGTSLEGEVRLWDVVRSTSISFSLINEERHTRWVSAVAVLADGRVMISLGEDGEVRVWAPASPDSTSIALGRHNCRVRAMAVVPDGRVVSAGDDGWVLMWDPASPGTSPSTLGRHDGGVSAVAALPDGRVISAGHDRRMWFWDLQRTGGAKEVSCAATAIAVAPSPSHHLWSIALAHAGHGISLWSLPRL